MKVRWERVDRFEDWDKRGIVKIAEYYAGGGYLREADLYWIILETTTGNIYKIVFGSGYGTYYLAVIEPGED